MDKNNRYIKIRLIVFSLFFSLGFILGSFIQRSERINHIIGEYSNNLLISRISADPLSVFLESFILNFLVLIFICLVNTSQIGLILNIAAVLCYGTGKGALIANLVCNGGIHGLGISVLILFPGMIIAVCSVLFFSACSVKNTEANFKSRFKQRFIIFLTCLFLIAFSAGLDVTSAEIYKALR